MTANKVVRSGDSGDCYDASLSWSQIARDLDTDYQQNVTVAVAVIIQNTQGTASQQLTIFIKAYRPQPFLVKFLKYIIIKYLRIKCDFSGSHNPWLSPCLSNSAVLSIGHRITK